MVFPVSVFTAYETIFINALLKYSDMNMLQNILPSLTFN